MKFSAAYSGRGKFRSRAPYVSDDSPSSQKTFFDLYRNLIQPFLGAVGPILIVSNVSLKILYSAFGGLKLER